MKLPNSEENQRLTAEQQFRRQLAIHELQKEVLAHSSTSALNAVRLAAIANGGALVGLLSFASRGNVGTLSETQGMVAIMLFLAGFVLALISSLFLWKTNGALLDKVIEAFKASEDDYDGKVLGYSLRITVVLLSLSIVSFSVAAVLAAMAVFLVN